MNLYAVEFCCLVAGVVVPERSGGIELVEAESEEEAIRIAQKIEVEDGGPPNHPIKGVRIARGELCFKDGFVCCR